MTVNKKDTVTIPTIWIIVVAPLLVALITTLATTKFASGRDSKQIEIDSKRIESLEKANDSFVLKEDMSTIREQLNRIENKIDNHIENSHAKIQR
jgi:predicted phage-related endonuclease